MFMRYRGGGVRHKSTQEATCCLLHDCETLDKRSFTFEHNCELFEEGIEGSGEDDIPMDDPSSAEEESGEEGENNGSEVEDGDVGDGEQRIDDELGDEMEEYGYSGLDQVLNDDEEDAEMFGDKDGLGPEDREDPTDEPGDAAL